MLNKGKKKEQKYWIYLHIFITAMGQKTITYKQTGKNQ